MNVHSSVYDAHYIWCVQHTKLFTAILLRHHEFSMHFFAISVLTVSERHAYSVLHSRHLSVTSILMDTRFVIVHVLNIILIYLFVYVYYVNCLEIFAATHTCCNNTVIVCAVDVVQYSLNWLARYVQTQITF